MKEDAFFKPVIDKGAQIAHNGDTIPSAQNIIRLVFDNHPLPLRIQRELFDQRKDISAVSASKELYQEINAQIKKHQDEMRVVKDMRVLKEEIRVLTEMWAMRHENEETRRELQKMQREAETR